MGLKQALVSDDVSSEGGGKGGLGAEAEEWTSGQARGQTRPGVRDRQPVGVLAAEVRGARSPRPLLKCLGWTFYSFDKWRNQGPERKRELPKGPQQAGHQRARSLGSWAASPEGVSYL